MLRLYGLFPATLYFLALLFKGSVESSGVGDVFTSNTDHLNTSHHTYFRDWYEMIMLEYGPESTKTEQLWTIGGHEREIQTRECLGALCLVDARRHVVPAINDGGGRTQGERGSTTTTHNVVAALSPEAKRDDNTVAVQKKTATAVGGADGGGHSAPPVADGYTYRFARASHILSAPTWLFSTTPSTRRTETEKEGRKYPPPLVSPVRDISMCTSKLSQGEHVRISSNDGQTVAIGTGQIVQVSADVVELQCPTRIVGISLTEKQTDVHDASGCQHASMYDAVGKVYIHKLFYLSKCHNLTEKSQTPPSIVVYCDS